MVQVKKKIILASGSPRRKQLLEWAEIDFDVVVADTDESFPKSLSIHDIPIFVARNKAGMAKSLEKFQHYHSQTPVLAADTIVVLNNQVIGKPSNREDAIKILSALSGNTHYVITGVVISNGKPASRRRRKPVEKTRSNHPPTAARASAASAVLR